MNILFFVLFMAMSLQVFLGFIQVKAYKRAMESLRGTGIVGLGHTKGGWTKKGKIVVLSYSPGKDQVTGCKIMKGISVFAKFKVVHDYDGLNWKQLEEKGKEEDVTEFRRYRKKHAYDATEYSKKKGALIQAVEAIQGRMDREKSETGKSVPAISLHDQALQKQPGSGQLAAQK